MLFYCLPVFGDNRNGRNKKVNNMKKLMIMTFGSLLLTACFGNMFNQKSEDNPLQHELDSLREVNSAQAEDLEECMTLIDQVNEGFRVIKEAEGQFDINDGNIESSNRDKMINNMQFVQDKLKENQALIDQLKKKVNTSNNRLAVLVKTIEKLEADLKEQNVRLTQMEEQLAERDIVIEQQNQQINELAENVDNLTSENEQRTAEIAAQDKELNRAWFVFGTKKELKENKILDGGEVLQNGNYNKSYFTEIDVRYVKDIQLQSKSAALLTTHPANSYQLTKNASGLYELHITNPTQFWSVSKYLVVQVK